jgi:hypothetical protein
MGQIISSIWCAEREQALVGARVHSEKVLCNAGAIIICLTSVLPAAYKKKNGGTSRGKCSTIVSSNVNVMDFLPARRCSILIDVLLLYVRSLPPLHLGRAHHLTTIQHNKHSLLAA